VSIELRGCGEKREAGIKKDETDRDGQEKLKRRRERR
jgi:hypothetical protein